MKEFHEESGPVTFEEEATVANFLRTNGLAKERLAYFIQHKANTEKDLEEVSLEGRNGLDACLIILKGFANILAKEGKDFRGLDTVESKLRRLNPTPMTKLSQRIELETARTSESSSS